MSHFTHTPGPWRASSTAEVTADAGRYIACAGDVDNHGSPEDQANARLIAAAPELLEAAKEMRELLEVIQTGPGGLKINGAHWKRWDGALAKATGKEVEP